ncbi:Exportin-T [Fasciola hepatica]|uniref:Exportin-T n=1 Tax=Fasciola hepatica TaxID=6192 RepID=A0A4E0R304_FASHE|nr:Exportin-T [Fasciola hepatica]
MDFDIDGLFNVHKLQQSKNIKDQKRLVDLMGTLNSADGWQLCASVLTGDSTIIPKLGSLPEDQRSSIAFLCCRVIEEFLKSSSSVQTNEAQLFSAFIWKWIGQLTEPNETQYQKYMIGKSSQLLCLAVLRYYPKYWPTIFHELLALMSDRPEKDVNPGSSVSAPLLNAIDVFLDTLINLDPCLVSRDVQLTVEELVRANEIKDYIRETSITALMNFCYHLVHLLYGPQLSHAGHLKKILVTVGLMASWVDLNLVGNAEWISLFSDLLRASLTECNAGALVRCGVYCHLLGLVTKGMTTTDKINLITWVWDQLGQLLLADPLVTQLFHSNSTGPSEPDDEALSSLRAFGTLLDACGLQLIESYRSLYYVATDGESVNGMIRQSSDETRSIRASTLNKIEEQLNLALHIFGHEDEQVSQAVVPFLRSYIALVKGTGVSGPSAAFSQPRRRSRNRNSSTSMDSPLPSSHTAVNAPVQSPGLVELDQSRLFLLKRLLFAVVSKMKTLPLQNTDSSDQDDSFDYRHDLRSLVGNLIQLDADLVLEIINQLIKHAARLLSTANNSVDIGIGGLSEIDVALSLFYLFGESCKAPKNDHFAPQFCLRSAMVSVMDILCTDSFSHFPHWALQLQYFEIMARYERYFYVVPENLFKIMVAFLDHRGLRSPWRSVRVRCAYLITPLIKSHRKTLVPYTEQLLAQFADLLQLPSEPDPRVTNSLTETQKVNGHFTPTNSPESFLSITETSFLYEAAAQLIAAGGGVSVPGTPTPTTGVGTVDNRSGHLFRMLLRPVFLQYNNLVEFYVSETDPKLSEARGRLVKQAADLITTSELSLSIYFRRTSRVFSQPKSIMTPSCQTVLCEALQFMLTALSRFPSEAGAPGRSAACAGVRAFLHRMVACLGPAAPSEQTGDSNNVSEILLTALTQAVPQLVRPLRMDHTANGRMNGNMSANIADAEQRWHELRDVIPLVTQVIQRYKNRCTAFLAACLPGLFTAICNALTEPVPADHLALLEERKLLRRSHLQLLLCVCQSLPHAFFQLLGTADIHPLVSILTQTEACIIADDPLGLRSGLLLFVQLIQSNAEDTQFYENFLLSQLVPFCVLAPTRPAFRLSDAQFSLALNEIGSCLVSLAQKQDGFCTYLQDVFLPGQQLSDDLIRSYVGTLKTHNVKDFQIFLRNLYAAFR